MIRLMATLLAVLAFGSVAAACTPIADRDQPKARAQGEAANNEFIPESKELSDCVGLVERPGCGSEGRGGWQMFLAFGVMIAGLVFIGWRVARGVRGVRRT
jgi:hypothetical protein